MFIMEIISIDGGKVPANRCDPSNGNKGCDEQEVKYIEKINKHYAELVRASATTKHPSRNPSSSPDLESQTDWTSSLEPQTTS